MTVALCCDGFLPAWTSFTLILVWLTSFCFLCTLAALVAADVCRNGRPILVHTPTLSPPFTSRRPTLQKNNKSRTNKEFNLRLYQSWNASLPTHLSSSEKINACHSLARRCHDGTGINEHGVPSWETWGVSGMEPAEETNVNMFTDILSMLRSNEEHMFYLVLLQGKGLQSEFNKETVNRLQKKYLY